jgi:hypothetical protein
MHFGRQETTASIFSAKRLSKAGKDGTRYLEDRTGTVAMSRPIGTYAGQSKQKKK